MIPIAQPTLFGNEKQYVIDALESGWISSIGPYIDRFEKSFAAYIGVKHAITTHNGTVALHLALAAAGIKEGDEVIVPDLTFIATANSVRYCHAVPVLTDVETDDWNISPEAIRRHITAKTKAIIPVHLYGNPARMDRIMEIAHVHRLIVIEDCAEAIGAEYHGKKTGAFGDIACFSFFGNKIMTSGEGGMCITDDDKLAETMRILRDHGMHRQKKYWYDHLGFNYRMTNLQAAIGLAQLEQLDTLLAMRDRIYFSYCEAFMEKPGFILQETHGNRHVNWMYTLRMKGLDPSRRDLVRERLKKKGIDSRPVFYPIHEMPIYKSGEFQPSDCPNTDLISAEGISLPTYPGLTEEEIRYIADALIESYDEITA